MTTLLYLDPTFMTIALAFQKLFGCQRILAGTLYNESESILQKYSLKSIHGWCRAKSRGLKEDEHERFFFVHIRMGKKCAASHYDEAPDGRNLDSAQNVTPKPDTRVELGLSCGTAVVYWQGLVLGAGLLKVRNPIPLKIRRVRGLLHAKSCSVQTPSRWCYAEV
ncbi:hypothetical protein AVEN_160966-1 [Araneus ventricosus]|uniref:Uncharacterized protein n=1 Tax=Araneus ventricosus TaxID=182803 RepID=A0A4Y2SNK1_ARAVE|nr:hypothetical protein AVEN_160966-1 [Araneus ventricosus]